VIGAVATDTVLMVMLLVPPMAWSLVSKVYVAVAPQVWATALLLVKPPRKVTPAFPAELFHVPPELIVTAPFKILVPVAEETAKVPVMDVVPVTVKLKPAAVKVVPVPTSRLPLIVKPTTVMVVAVPERVRFPPIAVVDVPKVLAPLPLKPR